MRRPHVFERSAPRSARQAYGEPANPAVAGRVIAAQLTHIMERAEAAGLVDLVQCLGIARVEAEKAAG